MNRKTLQALIALNVVLLAAVAMIGLTPTPPAEAQRLGSTPEYMMVAGQTFDRQEQTIYIVELSTARMLGVIYRGNDKQLEVVGGRELSVDLRAKLGVSN
jgi:hypothetical protein